MSIPKYNDSYLYGSSLVKPFTLSYRWTKSALYPSITKYNIIAECAIRSLKLLTSILALSITALPALAGRFIQIIHLQFFYKKDKKNLLKSTTNNLNLSHPSKSPEISIHIEEWDPKKEEDLKAYRHLNLNSSNSKESANKGDRYVLSSKKNTKVEEDPHGIIFRMAKYVIDNQKKHNKFIFYINDISSLSLDEAAINLKNHLKKEYANKELTIKISKIAGDMLENFPKINSASFLHPFEEPIYKEIPRSNKNLFDFFHKIKIFSETGLLVKEVNLFGEIADVLEEEEVASSIELDNLKLEPAYSVIEN